MCSYTFQNKKKLGVCKLLTTSASYWNFDLLLKILKFGLFVETIEYRMSHNIINATADFLDRNRKFLIIVWPRSSVFKIQGVKIFKKLIVFLFISETIQVILGWYLYIVAWSVHKIFYR